MHIKVIKGRKYFYESKRIGKKVISKYIGPVEKVRSQETENNEESVKRNDAEEKDDSYIG